MEKETQMMSKPKVSASAQRELDKAEEKFNKYQEDLKSLSHDEVRKAPILEEEPQTKLSSKEIQKNNDIWLKPERTIPDNQKFNENFQKEWEFQKEYVNFIAEHRELIGETIEIWTHKFGGKGASFWKVPTNKPVWGPRYLAEQIKKCRYVRYVTTDKPTSQGDGMTFYGSLIQQSQIQRLDAHPVSSNKSVFMGAA